MNKWLLLIVFLCLSVPSFAQQPAIKAPYEKDWRTVDSLMAKSLPQSAREAVQHIYREATIAGEKLQVMRAQLYLMQIGQNEENADSANIAFAEKQAATTAAPEKNIWYSVAAEQYWNYYQNNRWQILQRTAVAGEAPADFAQWDAAQFYKKVSSLYLASLRGADLLKHTDISYFEPLIVKGVHTQHLRPTLYDLLVFRAIDYFKNDEKELSAPAYKFMLSDPNLFASASTFTALDLSAKDSTSLHLYALKLYRRVLAFHLKDTNPEALIDADLRRLEFVYDNAVMPNKKQLYQDALERLVKKYEGNPAVAEAAFRIASLLRGDQPVYRRTYYDDYNEADDVENKADLVAVKKQLEKIVQRYPGSEGAAHAAQAISDIGTKTVELRSEEVVMPGEASRVSVAYRNVNHIFLRLLKIDPATMIDNGNPYQLAGLHKIFPVVQAWQAALPGAEDYRQHRTELKVDALQTGAYLLLASEREDFRDSDNLLSYVKIQASHLSVVAGNSGSRDDIVSGYVLDRKTGAAVGNAKLSLYISEWVENGRVYRHRKALTVSTGKDGSFSLGNRNGNYAAIEVSDGRDTLLLNEYMNIYRNSDTKVSVTRTLFFTDRSIYRPGQTVYFKGLMVQCDSGNRKNKVVPGRQTEVIFYDANSQKIESVKLTTNEYGSFHGSFIVPETGATGEFHIITSEGDIKYFRVEEYKRPKFEIRFDTLKSSYALNEPVTVKGFANAYAGNNIDGAAVKYRVTRQAHWPYEWMFYSRGGNRSSQQEIANGVTQTDVNGRFSITFVTIPDETVDEKTLPVFTYHVLADVTDVNGETHSWETYLSAGYRSIQIQAEVPDHAQPADLDTLNIQTQNLNNVFVASKLKMTISPLQQPQQPVRKRLWPKPDQFVMDEVTFRQYFPIDEYRTESDYRTWKQDAAVYTATFTTIETGVVTVPRSTWKKNGWYVIELETADSKGRKVTEKKYVQVWVKDGPGHITDAMAVSSRADNIQPGDRPEVHVVSGYTGMNWIQSEQTPVKVSVAGVKADGDRLDWSRTVTENDRGGIVLHWLAVRENRVYELQQTLPVAWKNKDLQISWETHRDRLQPGAKETWTMVVKGDRKENVAAEMAATLYDASLDAISAHSWDIYDLYPATADRISWNTGLGFGASTGQTLATYDIPDIPGYIKSYDHLRMTADDYYTYLWSPDSTVVMDPVTGETRTVVTHNDYNPGAKSEDLRARAAPAFDFDARTTAYAASPNGGIMSVMRKEAAVRDDEKPRHMILPEPAEPSPVSLRKNLAETAFFVPDLHTDAEGNIRISFTMPDALTEWKLLGFAHTKDMRYGLLTGKVKTQKDLMVVPGLPRFLRQGDDMIITAKISNLSGHTLSGTALLEIADAQTGKTLALPFRLDNAKTPFTVAAGQSTLAGWRIHVPESRYEPVALRISARSGDFTDGEENTLPVVSNRILVTETQPLWINGSGTKSFTLENLVQADDKHISSYNLSLEYTTNPAWYAVQALPYLAEFPYECAEQTFNRYYANALAAHIVKQAPKLRAVFDKWQTEDTAALRSNLQKNQELKTALLEETPWVMEAKSETEQQHRIALLFNAARMDGRLEAAIKQLKDMQQPEGGFPWFSGMGTDPYITQYIVTGIGRLQRLGVTEDNGRTKQILDKALPYLDRKLKEQYDALLKQKDKGAGQHIGYSEVQYLYMRSFFGGRSIAETVQPAVDYYKQQAVTYWPQFNPYMKGMIALALYRSGDKQTAGSILQSLRETAIRKEETGMYWPQQHSWWWYEAPVESQSLLVECFGEIAKDTTAVNEMKLWLLKQKQTQSWATTKATADACYALLLSGSQWLTGEPQVTIQLGKETVRSSEQKQQAGTGYFKLNYRGENIQPDMGNIKVTTANTGTASWGAVYWQYFRDMDQAGTAAAGVSVKKQLFIERNTGRGPELEAVTEGNPLKVGDKVKVRIEITSDRDMEYVHLKDMRSACFEPVNVLSGYRWQDGLGYYESTRDVSSNFFISYLAKGKYVFEYPVYVTHTGTYSSGMATLQCMYAPEFSAHSAGGKVLVK